MTITRTRDGFILSGNYTIIVRLTTFDGAPAVAYREPDEPCDCYMIPTKNRRSLAYYAYDVLRHSARWKPEKEWDV